MDLTTALTSMLPVIVVVSALLTAPTPVWLLRRSNSNGKRRCATSANYKSSTTAIDNVVNRN